jgi:hypothetical protein
MSVDMKHMEFLEMVVLDDVHVLRQKEATYQGSWKAAGGRSAWFMMRRNMDRLINMMKKPEDPKTGRFNPENIRHLADNMMQAGFDKSQMNCKIHASPMVYAEHLRYLCDYYVSENVFAKIRENPSGDDGTVLAVIRDLRRYLILIEAEMMARGVMYSARETVREKTDSHAQRYSAGKEKLGKPKTLCCYGCGVELPQGVGLPPIWRDADGHHYCTSCTPVTTAEQSRSERRVPRYDTEPVLEESEFAPFQVTSEYFIKNGVPDELARAFWQPMGSSPRSIEGLSMPHRLETHVVSETLPRVLHGYYHISEGVPTHWTLKIDRVPDEVRDLFPRLRRETNAVEHAELPEWQQYLYEWIEREVKFRLKKENEAWEISE